MVETWKSLADPVYGPLYEVSDLGRIKNVKTRKILKGYLAKGKTIKVTLHQSGRGETHGVRIIAVLVWEAFHRSIPNGYGMSYADGNRQNVALSNLSLIKSEQSAVNRGARVASATWRETKNIRDIYDRIFAEIAPESYRIINKTRSQWV